MIYGYVRVSTALQRADRQIANIKAIYPEAEIFTDKFTGTTMDRPQWSRLLQRVRKGDKIIFDEVSRMSRNADEGIKLYMQLFNSGIALEFIKEPHINTDVFKQSSSPTVSMTGTDIDLILSAINEYMMQIAKKQITLAFEQAQHEVDFLHQRTSEGMREAQANGKQIGRVSGSTIETEKAKRAKQIILKHSVSFGGSLSDAECIKLAGCSRNSFYKYKSALRESDCNG